MLELENKVKLIKQNAQDPNDRDKQIMLNRMQQMKLKLVSLQDRDRLIKKYQELKLRPNISSEKMFRPEHAKDLEIGEHHLIKEIKETE